MTSKFLKTFFSEFNTRDYPHSRNGKYGRRAGCYVFFHFPFLAGKRKVAESNLFIILFFALGFCTEKEAPVFIAPLRPKRRGEKKKGNMERKKEKTKQLFFSRHILTFPLLLVTLQDSFPYKKVGRPPRGKINAFSHAFYGFCLFSLSLLLPPTFSSPHLSHHQFGKL